MSDNPACPHRRFGEPCGACQIEIDRKIRANLPCTIPIPPGYGPCLKPRGHNGLHDFAPVCARCGELCPCLSEENLSPQERYDNAWLAYIEKNDVIRADAEVMCPTCYRSYRAHLQPLKELNPTVRILCDGQAVKL